MVLIIIPAIFFHIYYVVPNLIYVVANISLLMQFIIFGPVVFFTNWEKEAVKVNLSFFLHQSRKFVRA